jgi:hypothetical protein
MDCPKLLGNIVLRFPAVNGAAKKNLVPQEGASSAAPVSFMTPAIEVFQLYRGVKVFPKSSEG